MDWAKKITKAVGGDLAADEQVEAGLFLQPGGTTGRMMGASLGGVVGAAVAGAAQRKREDSATAVLDEGLAAGFPKERIVLGLTSRQMYVWGHSSLSGKPKGLKMTMPLGDVARVDVDKGKLSSSVTIHFTDGSGAVFEAPKLTDPEGFAAALSRLKG